MKKNILLILIVLFSTSISGVFAKDINHLKKNAIEINFLNPQKVTKQIKQSQKIVWNLILKDEKVIKDFDFVLSDIEIRLIDLNNDDKKDILYFISGEYGNLYCGTAGCSLGILQNIDNYNYKEISHSISFIPSLPIYILNKKTNGYKNIIFTGAYLKKDIKDFEQREISYNKKSKCYKDLKGENLLKYYLKNFSK